VESFADSISEERNCLPDDIKKTIATDEVYVRF
jgi:hypothetical protein